MEQQGGAGFWVAAKLTLWRDGHTLGANDGRGGPRQEGEDGEEERKEDRRGQAQADGPHAYFPVAAMHTEGASSISPSARSDTSPLRLIHGCLAPGGNPVPSCLFSRHTW